MPDYTSNAKIPKATFLERDWHLVLRSAFDAMSGDARAVRGGAYSRTRRSSCALIATMIVLSDMSTAPTAGERTIPHGARTPAASGMATML